MPYLDAEPISASHETTPVKGPIGVVVNRLSLGNRRGSETLRSAPRADLHVTAPGSLGELEEVLGEFARRKVATIVIEGGDGTVRDVMTALIGAYGTGQPDIAIMPSGNTNLIARTMGGIPVGPSGLERLVRAIAGDLPLKARWQPALDVTWPDQPGRILRGMVLGAAVFTGGVRLANETLRPLGIRSRTAVAVAAAGTLVRMALGSGRRAFRVGNPMSVGIDGLPAIQGPRFLVLVTPLDRLVLGLWPFADTGEGPLHWLDVKAPPHGLLRMVAASIGRGPSPARLAAWGHGSGRAREVAMTLSDPFVVDGDRFEAGRGGIRLAASPPLRFLSA